MSELRIGLVGTGGIGRTHIERINTKLQGGTVVACADPAGAFGFSIAEKYGIKDTQVVSVKIPTEGRALIFGDVVVRVSPSYALAMHIDTDEANAAGMKPNTMGTIIK